MLLVGVIADTHGMLRPEAVAALRGSDLILHAGDIGRPKVIEELSTIAPVSCVRGNVDMGEWARDLPDRLLLRLESVLLLLVHDRAAARESPGRPDVVVFGHSHQPLITSERGKNEGRNTLFFNPGSAGPRRFTLPVCVGRLTIDNVAVIPELVPLED